jgi:hypothetical protein
MTAQQKPNDPPISDMTWAEAGPSTYDPGSEEPIKPTDQLVTGYGKQEPLPHAQFNWLFRSVMRWITWLVSKVDSHVHDGLGTDASAPKVNASQHLDWGTNGSVSVTTDTNSVHEITHGPTSGGATTKRIITGQLQAPTYVRTTTVQANGQGTTAAVNVRDTNGNHGFLDSAIIRTGQIRRNAPGAGTINLRDSNGDNNTTLNVNRTTQERSTILIAGQPVGLRLTASESDGLIIKDSITGNNFVPLRCSSINSTNVPKYVARINANGTVASSFLAVSGSVTIQKTNVVSTTGVGEYTFTLPFTNSAVFVTLIGNRGFVSYDRISDSQIRVLTTNTSNSYMNQNFSIVII